MQHIGRARFIFSIAVLNNKFPTLQSLSLFDELTENKLFMYPHSKSSSEKYALL